MNDHDILLAIQELLDGVTWDGSMLEQIAERLNDNGYRIRDSNDMD